MVNFPVGGHNNIREIWDGTVKSQPFVFVYVDMLYVILYVNYTSSGCKGNNLFSFHQIFSSFLSLNFYFSQLLQVREVKEVKEVKYIRNLKTRLI